MMDIEHSLPPIFPRERTKAPSEHILIKLQKDSCGESVRYPDLKAGARRSGLNALFIDGEYALEGGAGLLSLQCLLRSEIFRMVTSIGVIDDGLVSSIRLDVANVELPPSPDARNDTESADSGEVTSKISLVLGRIDVGNAFCVSVWDVRGLLDDVGMGICHPLKARGPLATDLNGSVDIPIPNLWDFPAEVCIHDEVGQKKFSRICVDAMEAAMFLASDGV